MIEGLARGFICISVAALIGVLCLPMPALIGVLAIFMSLGAAWFVRPRKPLVIAAIAIAVPIASALTALGLRFYPWSRGEIEVPVEQAHLHPEADVFHFTNARVATEHASQVKYGEGRHSTGPSFAMAAPLVSNTWKKGELVTAWVVSLDHPNNLWNQPLGRGIRVAPGERCEIAIEAVTKQLSYDVHKDAPILWWTADPFGEKRENLLQVVWRVLILYALWSLALIASRLNF